MITEADLQDRCQRLAECKTLQDSHDLPGEKRIVFLWVGIDRAKILSVGKVKKSSWSALEEALVKQGNAVRAWRGAEKNLSHIIDGRAKSYHALDVRSPRLKILSLGSN